MNNGKQKWNDTDFIDWLPDKMLKNLRSKTYRNLQEERGSGLNNNNNNSKPQQQPQTYLKSMFFTMHREYLISKSNLISSI